MVKKIVAFLSAAVLVLGVSGVLYADASGVLFSDKGAAKSLVDKYMTAVMKSYSEGEKVSFRGIVKEGCDFWYYNDYNNALICEMSKSEGLVDIADYNINFGKVSYSDRKYTIDVEITQNIKYKNSAEILSVTCHHTFVIEQCGRNLLITNDVSDGTDKLLAPIETNKP